jgi:N6-L-threonylcarbamoyladenine synthase
MEMLGTTIDDAVGEAYDKVSRLLGLGYPGGPVIDSLALKGDPGIKEFADMPFLLPDNDKDRYNFSYSGLKTAIAYRLKRIPDINAAASDVSAVFQRLAIGMLCRKSKNALEDFKLDRLVVSGGVAANSYLRSELGKMKKEGIEIFMAPPAYCSDNAAMVAGRGYEDFMLGKRGDLRTEAFSRIPMIKKGKR